jgi:hypothetical protein
MEESAWPCFLCPSLSSQALLVMVRCSNRVVCGSDAHLIGQYYCNDAVVFPDQFLPRPLSEGIATLIFDSTDEIALWEQ